MLVHNSHDLQRCCLQRRFHGFGNLYALYTMKAPLAKLYPIPSEVVAIELTSFGLRGRECHL